MRLRTTNVSKPSSDKTIKPHQLATNKQGGQAVLAAAGEAMDVKGLRASKGVGRLEGK